MSKGSIDFAAINASALAGLEGLLNQWFPNGHREGPEFKVGSLSGEPGRSLSVNVRTGTWKDFSSDASGKDPVSLLAAIKGCTQGEAARELRDGGYTSASATAAPKAPAQDWEALPHASPSCPAATFRHHRFGTPSATWEYKDAEGRTAGYVCRFDLPDGGKDVVPKSWCKHPTKNPEWRWKAFCEPRPLYGLDLISRAPANAGVLIVEGEKAADAARRLLPGVLVVTWAGGSKAIKKTDWAPLKGRPVVIWPDRDRHLYDARTAPTPDLAGTEIPWQDQVGFKAACDIARIIGESCKIIVPDSLDCVNGWDAADAEAEGMAQAQAVALAKSARPLAAILAELPAKGSRKPVEASAKPPAAKPQAIAPEPQETPPWEGGEEPPATWSEPAPHRLPDDEENRVAGLPFQMLGMDGDSYHYLPDCGQHIVSLSASGHTKNNLFQLAPLQRWEAEFPGSESGFALDAAANALIQRSLRLPKFDPRRIRGRGCWIDGEDVVFHAGDRLFIGGQEFPIPAYRSHVRAVYEGGLEIDIDGDTPASNEDAAKLIALCEMLSWERPLYGKLLAGWLALAPICGALQWRPHVWITGPSGSGKSWTVANVIAPMVGRSAVHVQGNSTEAGLRQQIGCDALPVLFDEAESEDKRGQQRLDGVLELARQASSESGAGIVKGSANGTSITYLVRSAFLFASIGVAATKKADTSRVSTLTLKKNMGEAASEHFEKVKALAVATTMSAGFCSRVRARSLRNARVIRRNALIFSDSAVAFTGDKRSADQVGALLAGAYSLTSSKEITHEAATKWMAAQDWSGFKSEEIDNDENQCFAHLMTAGIRIDAFDSSPAMTLSVDEIVSATLKSSTQSYIKEGERALARAGVKIDLATASIVVANAHQGLERIFTDTAWSRGKWKQQLERMPRAQKLGVVNFGNSVRQRAVSVPIYET